MVVKRAEEPGSFLYTSAYPTVDTVHGDSICKLVYAPARRVLETL
jgi:phosphoribosylaminoimidazole carboxylase (NCAIR synthetase)